MQDQKFQWEKLGLVFSPQGKNQWDFNSALTPTPVVFSDKVRVYAGIRDQNGISRIGYVDLNPANPSDIINVSSKPVLDIGEPGSFDDNGIILGDIIQVGDQFRMYYVGFQLVEKVKFLAFTGLAVSVDEGETFTRQTTVPVLDRQENAQFFNAVHTVRFENGKFRFWLGAGSGFELINDIPYPSYNIKYTESDDGINFINKSKDCLNFSSAEEYRLGRPRVYCRNSIYHMIFTWGNKKGNYQMGYATSTDGENWNRDDARLNFYPSEKGWDDKWVSYGALFDVNNNTYMVYNGNEMGKDGFGLAILKK